MNKIPALTSLFGTPLAFLFGAWNPLMAALLVFNLLDVITGIAKGIYNRDLVSKSMKQGMISKAMQWISIIVVNMIDLAMFDGLPLCKSALLLYLMAMEGLSIVENIGQCGVKLPSWVEGNLRVLRDKGMNPENVKSKEKN